MKLDVPPRPQNWGVRIHSFLDFLLIHLSNITVAPSMDKAVKTTAENICVPDFISAPICLPSILKLYDKEVVRAWLNFD